MLNQDYSFDFSQLQDLRGEGLSLTSTKMLQKREVVPLVGRIQWDRSIRREGRWILKFAGNSCRVYRGKGRLVGKTIVVERMNHCAKCGDKADFVVFLHDPTRLRKEYDRAELMCEHCCNVTFLAREIHK